MNLYVIKANRRAYRVLANDIESAIGRFKEQGVYGDIQSIRVERVITASTSYKLTPEWTPVEEETTYARPTKY